MKDEVLNDANFVLYCAKHYDVSKSYSTDEFYDDIKKYKYIKKLLSRSEKIDNLERLILNHIITLNNMFGETGTYPLNRMLFQKIKDPKQRSMLKPFLIFLNILQPVIRNINNDIEIITDEIPMDLKIVEALRKI